MAAVPQDDLVVRVGNFNLNCRKDYLSGDHHRTIYVTGANKELNGGGGTDGVFGVNNKFYQDELGKFKGEKQVGMAVSTPHFDHAGAEVVDEALIHAVAPDSSESVNIKRMTILSERKN